MVDSANASDCLFHCFWDCIDTQKEVVACEYLFPAICIPEDGFQIGWEAVEYEIHEVDEHFAL